MRAFCVPFLVRHPRISAFLKEWGRVKALVLVVSSGECDAGALDPGVARACGVVVFGTRVRRSQEGRLGCQAFLR